MTWSTRIHGLTNYDGIKIDDPILDLTIESDRTHVHGPRGWWMGRVYALRHPDPAKMVIATDVDFCGTLSHSKVIDWDGSMGKAIDAVEAEIGRWERAARAPEGVE